MSLPNRADQVGSYLRSDILKKARADFEAGTIKQDDLTAVEDAEIKKLVEKQVAAGLKDVTDGEFRRQSWLFDFNWNFKGVDHFRPTVGMKFANSTASIIDLLTFTGEKVEYNPDHSFFAAFEYLKGITPPGVLPKVCIPSPSMINMSLVDGKPPAGTPYTTIDEFITDWGLAYQKTIQHLYDIGLRYLQIDDCAWSAAIKENLGRFGPVTRTPEEIAALILRLNIEGLKNRPKDLFIAMHHCRGNNQSDYGSTGAYDEIAKFIAQVPVDAFFLEFDGARCGGFEGLKDIAEGPYGKTQKVVLGLVSSKVGALENEEAVIARIHEASKYFPLERLCLSTQCGFASTDAGNRLTEEEQFAKVRLVHAIAKKVWG